MYQHRFLEFLRMLAMLDCQGLKKKRKTIIMYSKSLFFSQTRLIIKFYKLLNRVIDVLVTIASKSNFSEPFIRINNGNVELQLDFIAGDEKKSFFLEKQELLLTLFIKNEHTTVYLILCINSVRFLFLIK